MTNKENGFPIIIESMKRNAKGRAGCKRKAKEKCDQERKIDKMTSYMLTPNITSPMRIHHLVSEVNSFTLNCRRVHCVKTGC